MADTVKHKIEVVKPSLRSLQESKIVKQIDQICNRALPSGRKDKGWNVETQSLGRVPDQVSGGYTYRRSLNFICAPQRQRDQAVMDKEFNTIVKLVADAGKKAEWSIQTIDGRKPKANDDRLPEVKNYATVEIPKDWESYFKGIFGRENQIEIIRSAIEAGINSDWHDRFHVVLVGDPAAGKTEIVRRVKLALGADACLEYDATATTQAGAIKDISESDELPRILLIEEIEKTDENSLRWLLGVLDFRAEIRKTTYKDNIQKEAKMLCIATVNDYDLFKKVMSGALESRFAWPLYCPAPDRDTLAKILLREVDRVKGKREWIGPTLDLGEQEDITDPRKLIAICLCGRDKLLNGSYQRKMRAVSTKKWKELKKKRKEDEKNA